MKEEFIVQSSDEPKDWRDLERFENLSSAIRYMKAVRIEDISRKKYKTDYVISDLRIVKTVG